MTEALWQRMDAIEKFAADVSHEIKNPLTSLRSAVETVARISDIEKQKKLMAIILDDVQRLDRLISDISDASRPIKAPKETSVAAENGINYVELRLGTDGLSVVVSPDNDFVDCLTTDELKSIWGPESTIDNWKQVRSSFPDTEMRLYGPDTDSGTFDYFTEEVMGEAQVSRADYTASADDNVLVQGIAGDKGSLGYFGYAYYQENTEKLKLVAVDSGSGCVKPSLTTIPSGEYSPLSRPLYIYVNTDSYKNKPAVKELVDFYMINGPELINEVGYVTSDSSVYSKNKSLLGN